ncbi:hypothetical protein, partial [Rothia terrae]|uniref:hypothetical protein n=1 Tax=Rothia terrae TaxID=396015 RepID=UPI001B34F518
VATVLPVWLEVICRDLTLIFLPLVGPLSSWWVWGVLLLLNKPLISLPKINNCLVESSGRAIINALALFDL